MIGLRPGHLGVQILSMDDDIDPEERAWLRKRRRSRLWALGLGMPGGAVAFVALGQLYALIGGT